MKCEIPMFAEAYMNDLRRSSPSLLTLCGLQTESDRIVLAESIRDAYNKYVSIPLDAHHPLNQEIFLRDFLARHIRDNSPLHDDGKPEESEAETAFFDEAIPHFLDKYFAV